MGRVQISEGESPAAYLWESVLNRAIAGKRGQAFLRELEAALLHLPRRRVISESLARSGDVCTLGALALHRKVRTGVLHEEAIAELERRSDDVSEEMWDYASGELGIARTLAWEIIYRTDDITEAMTPEQRYDEMLLWVGSNLKSVAA